MSKQQFIPLRFDDFQRIYTISNMHNEAARDWVERAYETLNLKEQPDEMELPYDVDVVLDFSLQGYYLTSFTSQRVFWLVEVDVDLVTQNLRQVLSEEHLRK